MFFIYAIINKINNKLYIGKTNNLKRRWQDHKKIAKGNKEKYKNNFRTIHATMKKYGIDNFVIVNIEETDSEICAYELEKFWVSYFESRTNGYNETPGGEGFSSGKDHYLYGKHHKESTKQKLKEARKGRKPSLGLKASEETKKKLSLIRLGNKNAMYGKHHSEKSKKLISEIKLASKKCKGESHYLSTLTMEQAQRIRLLFSEHKTKAELAKLFNAKWITIHRIIIGETYKN